MFCKTFIRGKLHVKKLLPSIYFSARNLSFVEKAKALEELKTDSAFPHDVFRKGKYMLLLKTDLVCVGNNNNLLWKDFQEIETFASDELHRKILLGIADGSDSGNSYLFALDLNIKSDDNVRDFESETGGKFINARESLFILSNKDSQYVAQAKGLSHFNKTMNFCSICGNELTGNPIGTMKKCERCHHSHYPHVAPVGIVLIEDSAHKKVLLVRQSRHPPGMLSCVAGFLEPGETLCQGIQREVAEEVGLELNRIEFINSQHWAMPSSQLMLACIGTATGEEFILDEKEIQKALWVEAGELKEAVTRLDVKNPVRHSNDDKVFWVPPPFTASHQLMVEWLKRHHSRGFDE